MSKVAWFLEKNLLKIICVFWYSLQLLSKTFLILRRIHRDIIILYISLHVKCLLLLPDFKQTSIFLVNIQTILRYQISRKSVHWERGSYMQTKKMAKQIVTFCNAANIPKNSHWHLTTTKDINFLCDTWNLLASKMGEFEGSVYMGGGLSNNNRITIIKWMNVTNGNTFKISKLEYSLTSSMRLVSGS
jgi:hypothetical protein